MAADHRTYWLEFELIQIQLFYRDRTKMERAFRRVSKSIGNLAAYVNDANHLKNLLSQSFMRK